MATRAPESSGFVSLESLEWHFVGEIKRALEQYVHSDDAGEDKADAEAEARDLMHNMCLVLSGITLNKNSGTEGVIVFNLGTWSMEKCSKGLNPV